MAETSIYAGLDMRHHSAGEFGLGRKKRKDIQRVF